MVNQDKMTGGMPTMVVPEGVRPRRPVPPGRSFKIVADSENAVVRLTALQMRGFALPVEAG